MPNIKRFIMNDNYYYFKNAPVHPGERQPGANTMAYRPLTESSTTSDMSGHNYNLTQTDGSFVTIDGVSCFYNGGGTTGYLTLTSAPLIPSGSNDRTILFWVRPIDYSTSYTRYVLSYGAASTDAKLAFTISLSGNYNFTKYSSTTTMGPIAENTWSLLAITISNNSGTLYVNGSSVSTMNTFNTSAISSSYPLRIMRNNTTNSSSEQLKGYISNVIIENIARTSAQISDYYNYNKSRYGLT